MTLLIENNTDKSITVQSRDTYINGYSVDAMMSVDVAPGKKANDELTFLKSDLKKCNITTIASIDLVFHVFDSETWKGIFDSELITIETSAAKDFEYVFDNSGYLLYNVNGVEIVLKGLSVDDSYLGPSLMLHISNNGDKNITVQAKNVSINGFMIDSIFSCEVLKGKHAIDGITFMKKDLEENDIVYGSDIKEIEFSFHFFDSEDWKNSYDADPIKISFD